MAEPDIPFGEGDTGPAQHKFLELEDGTAIDLTDCVVHARYVKRNAEDPEVLEPVVVDDDPTTGGVTWTPAGPMPAGTFHFNWVITPSGGGQITVPNLGHLLMVVTPKGS